MPLCVGLVGLTDKSMQVFDYVNLERAVTELGQSTSPHAAASCIETAMNAGSLYVS